MSLIKQEMCTIKYNVSSSYLVQSMLIFCCGHQKKPTLRQFFQIDHSLRGIYQNQKMFLNYASYQKCLLNTLQENKDIEKSECRLPFGM